MPDLLEDIATTDAAVLARWAEGYAAHTPQLDALPQDKRARELLTLAREFTRRASWAADTADGWLAEFHARLRVGMSSLRMKPLLDSGRELCRTCRTVFEVTDDLWRLTEVAGAPADDIRDARNSLTAAGGRVAKIEAEIATFTKRVERMERPRTEADWARITAGMERGKRQIEAGLGMTIEQARAALRKSE